MTIDDLEDSARMHGHAHGAMPRHPANGHPVTEALRVILSPSQAAPTSGPATPPRGHATIAGGTAIPQRDHAKLSSQGRATSSHPWYVRAILVRPSTIGANLERVRATYDLPRPTEWQLCLGVLRLWHRLLFRTETVGTSNAGTIRATRRARLLAWRALRLPALLRERAVVPLDFSGLGSSPARLIRHLLGAHHDANQFVYDLEVLGGYGQLDALHAAVTEIVTRDSPRARWLRDLAVFEGYHESLLAACERALADGPAMSARDANDPDISLRAYLRWCAEQPTTPRATLAAWHTGTFRFDSALRATSQDITVDDMRLHAKIATTSESTADGAGAPMTSITGTLHAARPPASSRLTLTPAHARTLSARALASTFAGGRTFEPDQVAGWIYRGTSLGLPRFIERLSWIKFAKAFHRDGDLIRGWNIRIEQDDLALPWRPQLRGGRAVTFGPFVVVRGEQVVLDYGLGGGGLRVLRDPLVALDDRGDVLLGRSLIQIGDQTIPTPSYFLLERDSILVDPR